MGFDCKKWLNPQALDLWSEWTASCSLFDIDPESKSLDALASGPTSIRILLDAEGGAGNIKCHIYNGVRHYLRKDFIEWAVSKKFPVREEMLIFAGKLKPKPEADQRTEPEGVKDEDLSIYEQRKEHFNKWRVDSGVDIAKALTDEDTLDILKQLDKNLWNLKLGSYRSEFWNHYKEEYGIKKRRGRRAKR